jgi:hypothetical protein
MIPAPPHNFQQPPVGGHVKRVLGWLDDGAPVFERTNEDLETFHILPAPAGWYALQWYDGDDAPDEERICKTAVVAWKVTVMSSISHFGKVIGSTWTTPITADCTDWGEMDHSVLGPDGIVYRYEEVPQPFEKWLEAKKQELAEKQRREKLDLKVAV